VELEPRELTEARDRLARFEERQNNPSALSDLLHGLERLHEIIEGDHLTDYKRRAQNLLRTYQSMVLAKIEPMISKPESFVIETMDHWRNVMKTFSDAGFDDDEKFNVALNNLSLKLLSRRIQLLNPWEREQLLKELKRPDTA